MYNCNSNLLIELLIRFSIKRIQSRNFKWNLVDLNLHSLISSEGLKVTSGLAKNSRILSVHMAIPIRRSTSNKDSPSGKRITLSCRHSFCIQIVSLKNNQKTKTNISWETPSEIWQAIWQIINLWRITTVWNLTISRLIAITQQDLLMIKDLIKKEKTVELLFRVIKTMRNSI